MRVWKHRTGEFELGRRTILVGVVNVTPDSFSDGGKFVEIDDAVRHALELEQQGADIVELGAESTRPGSDPVDASRQLARLEPVLTKLKDQIHVPISVDTSLAEVADRCLTLGASLVNDVTSFTVDRAMAQVCAASRAGVILMHMRGTPKTMQQQTTYLDVVKEVGEYLRSRVLHAENAGIARDHLVIDPGIGFGKTFDQNHLLIANLKDFAGYAAGVMVGPSRKAFTAQFSGKPAGERQFATAAAVVLSRISGADIIRVHDVAAMREVCDFVDHYRAINAGEFF